MQGQNSLQIKKKNPKKKKKEINKNSHSTSKKKKKKINQYNMPHNRFKGKNQVIIDAGKTFFKNPTHFLDKNNQKTRNRRKVSSTW